VRRLSLIAAAVAVAVAGCTSQPGDLTATAQRVLVPKVQDVRDAAATGSYAQLAAAVRALKRAVERERLDHQVTDPRAAAIDDAADKLLLDATPSPAPSRSASPSPSPSQTSPSPTPTTPSPSQTSPSATPTESSSSPSPGTTISVGGLPAG